MEMASLQLRQRPRNRSQLSTGILSDQEIFSLQEGQKDLRGLPTLSPSRGRR